MGHNASKSTGIRGRRRTTTSADGTDVSVTSEGRVLSWATVLDALGIDVESIADSDSGLVPPVEVTTTETDIHYLLFQDCLHYLRDAYPIDSKVCSVPARLRKKAEAGGLPYCFSTLLNLQLDIQWLYKLQPPRSEPTPAWVAEVHSLPVLSSIRFAMVATTLAHHPRAGHWHAICAIMASESPGVEPTESDLYQALFLDCMGALLRAAYSHRCLVTWSPMPWSAMSMKESSTMSNPDVLLNNYESPMFDESDLPAVQGDLIHKVRWTLGCPMDIPWLGASHDGYPFCATLPSYTKVRIHELRKDTIRSLRDDAALWLSAMSFGLLEAITRTRIPESLFLVQGAREGGSTLLSGQRILQFIAWWWTFVEQHYDDEDMQAERGREIAGLLRRALHALEEEYDDSTGMLRRAGLSSEERDNILFALLCLIVPLCLLVTTNSRWSPRLVPEVNYLNRFLSKREHFSLMIHMMQSCQKRLQKAGWCPSSTLSITSRQFLIMVISNLVQLPPVILPTPTSHARCTEQACEFYNVWDPDAYVPRHADRSCRCEYVRPPLDEVLDLLSKNVIPVVIFDGKSLQVLPSGATPYVAISHVWAQGMGSSTDDGLPGCVVRRIASLARTLHPERGAFWMDSLCVPKAKKQRQHAILHMSETYRDAASVLVIDDCIRTQCSANKPWRENLLRIATSAWVRRVWTLQEGLLARELCFEFLEGPVDVEKVWNLTTPMEDKVIPPVLSPWSLEELFTPVALVPVLGFRSTQRQRSVPETAVSHLVTLLHLRTTTKAEDELIAIGSLLPRRVKVERLLAERDGPNVVERRMRAFLLQLRDVPRGVPFGHAPRMALPNFGWAPRALVDENAKDWWEGAGFGICVEDGFVAEYFMLPFHVPSVPPSAVIRGVTETPDEGSWGVRVLHSPSSTVHLIIDPRDSGRPFFGWSTVDALLFLEGDLSRAPVYDIPWDCLAVHFDSDAESGDEGRGHEAIVGPGTLQDDPLTVRVVAHWRFYRLDVNKESETLGKGLPSLPVDDPQKTWVKLT